jgi:quercetin dioxygenase-like cupin family protein
MTRPPRRVVTGHDKGGKARVLFDGPAPNVKLRKASGLTSTLVWVTDESPADVSGFGDQSERDIGVAPPTEGSVFRIVDFPPLHEVGQVDNAAMIREMGLQKTDRPLRHATMHRTRSIDYAIVISGEIDMLLDDSEVHLSAGDVLVQQATNHAWVNRGRETCRIAFVLIDAREPGGRAARSGHAG